MMNEACLLYTSDAAYDMHGVDLGCRRIIKKSNVYDESRWIENCN